MPHDSSADGAADGAAEALHAAEARRETRWKITNFVAFQVVYTACVLGAAHGLPWLGPLTALILYPLNLLFADDRPGELRLWAIAGLLGAAVDSALMHAGLIEFPASARIFPDSAAAAAMVPLWIVILWIGVGTLLRASLAWLGRRRGVLFAFAALTGPFSFWSGARLGATELPRGPLSLSVLALEYAVLVPLLFAISRRLIRVGPPPASRP